MENTNLTPSQKIVLLKKLYKMTNDSFHKDILNLRIMSISIRSRRINVKCIDPKTGKFKIKEAELLRTLKSGDALVLIDGVEKWKARENIVK